ncbi:MAG: DNA gyrase subunit A, partial [Microgenomates group bacterium]
YIDNFDGRLQEPTFLPAKLPNLLLMGAEGIAVGMATKIPPHNLAELIDAITFSIDKAVLATIDAKKKVVTEAKQDMLRLSYQTTTEELLEYVKGPDFPTYGVIYGAKEIQEVYATGRGKILIRGVVEEEELDRGRQAIVITQLPYQVNKANLVEKIANLVNDKKMVGISDLRDESDRDGIRVVIELKRDASYKKVLNNLFKFTELQTTFPANIVALVDGIPQTLGLKPILEHYIKHRVTVIVKRSEYELAQAKYRAHILEGYLIALDHIDEVIKVIKTSKNEPEAKTSLMAKFKLSEIQAQSILDMQLKRLTGLERAKIEEELKELKKKIAYLEGLLKDVFKILGVIKDEIAELKTKFGDERRTKVIKSRPGEITDEQLIENKEVIVVMTKEGYIKQVDRQTFKVQNRGGKGVMGIETKDTDNVAFVKTAMAHDYILFFSNQGRVFQTRVWEIPLGTRTSKGKAVANLVTLRPEEKITSLLTYDKDSPMVNTTFVLMSTKDGTVKKTPFDQFAHIRTNGIVAIKLDAKDELLWVGLTDGKKHIILTTRDGKAIVFNESEIRPTGRSSMGVKGITLENNNAVIAAHAFGSEEFKQNLFVIGERGVGKKTQLSNFKGQHRAGKGVKVASVDDKMGKIAFVEIVQDGDEGVIITSSQGQVVKIPLKDIPSRSRSAKGVILMRFSQAGDKVSTATLL